MAQHSSPNIVFPESTEIPSDYTLHELNQTTYLIDGKLHEWTGPQQEVLSPIYLKTQKGLEAKRIGSYPLLSAKESLIALEAAEKAFAKGRGEWPTMSVAQRRVTFKCCV